MVGLGGGGQEVLAVDGEDVQVCGLHWGTSRRQGPPGLSTVSGSVTGSGSTIIELDCAHTDINQKMYINHCINGIFTITKKSQKISNSLKSTSRYFYFFILFSNA